jgi:hypothetical protein
MALPALAALIIFCIGAFAGAGGAESGQAVVSPPQWEHIDVTKKKGVDTSLTILPVRLAGQPFDRLTEVVGLLLEQRGLRNIELAKSVFNPQNWEQGYVHFVICDRRGEWVIVDMQNSHHPDYQSVKPISQADCDKILVKRLEQYVR